MPPQRRLRSLRPRLPVLNGQRWESSQEEKHAHVVWVAASPASLRDNVLDYMTAYLDLRDEPFDLVEYLEGRPANESR